MLNSFKPISPTIGANSDEQNANKYNSRLHFKGKPVLSWLRNSSNTNSSTISKSNITQSTDQLNNNNNKGNQKQTELRGVQNLRHLWNTRISAGKDTKLSSAKVLSPAKSYGCLADDEKTSSNVSRALSLNNCSELEEPAPSLRSTKDNFYKYKTAATTEKNCVQSPTSPPTNFLPGHITSNFPMIGASSKGEKIHWMRRDDIVLPRKCSTQEPHLSATETDSDLPRMTSSQKVEASPATPNTPKRITLSHKAAISSDNNSNDSNHSPSVTSDAISSHCSSNSLRSVESATPRKKNANSNRKYSFKTQVKSYHSPRKMPHHTGSTACNKVAKLTQQFNEIIHKDKKILEEVKRKNGILISRGGRVYKVIENPEQQLPTTQPNSVLPVGNVESVSGILKNNSTVQRAIKNFENKTKEKPKVPLKSAQLLRIKKELANRKDVKSELKPTPLEEIKEESKAFSENPVLNDVTIQNNVPILRESESECDLNKSAKEFVNEDADEISDIQLEAGIVPKDIPCSEERSSESATKARYTKIYKKFRFRIFQKNERANSKPDKSGTMVETSSDGTSHSELSGANPTDGIQSATCTEVSLSVSSEVDKSPMDLAEEAFETPVTTAYSTSSNELDDKDSKGEFNGSNDLDIGNQDSKELPEDKILSALEEVNQKIECLASKSVELVLPNESFLHQSKVTENEYKLVEAVNTSLVNFTESQVTGYNLTEENDAEVHKDSVQSTSDDGTYELIGIDASQVKERDFTVQAQKSFLFCNGSRNPETTTALNEVPQIQTNNNYDSYENYESINGSFEAKPCVDNGYELCATPDSTKPPRPEKEPTEFQRNTTDKLPELPKPKRIVPKKLFATVITAEISPQESECGSANDEENIYDTIKGGHHCYESLQSSKEKYFRHADTISLTSNGYESINHCRRLPILVKAGSSSTISSDHKTNSLYEVSMISEILASCHNYSHSYIASSENSDDWVDISDSEVNTYDRIEKQQFIVVRERTKCHRSPDWSKKVRDKRLHQTISDDDDVDHYYEPLNPLRNKSCPNKVISSTSSDNLKDGHYSNKSSYFTEDYDSFDTDDDIYEDEDSIKKNDSGVDICNVSLPNPPPSKNQVYAFVKKFKNFISSKKSPSDPNKTLTDSIQAKMYEDTQFQVEGNEYQSTLKPTRRAPDKPKTPKTKIKNLIDKSVSLDKSKDDNIYENTDFHSPKLKPTSLCPGNATQLSSSEKNLIAANDVSMRTKSKTGKSFKSRLKGFGTTNFDGKQLSTLSIARSTFYVSETNTSEQDSGIFEKTYSGELANVKSESNPAEIKPVAAVRKNKKDTNTSTAFRRRTTIGIRPSNPPPPPPVVSDEAKKPKQRLSTTSWYAECGVFKIGSNMNIDDSCSEKQLLNLNKSTSGTSWYAEAGLYQTSGVSVASSSGSSGVSTGNEGGIGDDVGHHMFLNEPLYQIYNAEKLESISRDMQDQETADGYEEIGVSGKSTDGEQVKRTRPTALQLVGPKSGPSRTLWSEISEVITSEILLTLTPRERSLQEAKFEIITSEASYLKSLNLLRTHFMNHETFHDAAILSSRDRKTLFSYIAPVHECSEKLLSELENCWQDNIMLLGLSKSIYQCAEKNFHVYISYCEHQGKMDRALRRLKEGKSAFSQKLDLLEADPVCCGLTLHSFLMLPMQRITRLPLLIDAVFSKVHPNDDEYDNWKLTLAILNKIVAQCNDAANRCEQAYEIERIARQLEFPSYIRALAIAPVGVAATGAKPRFLVKKGELVHLVWRGDDAKLTFGKKFIKSNIYAFLFSDLLVLTKRKSEDLFTVFDYCPRNMLTISSGDAIPQLPIKDTNQTGKNLILMTLLENYERKTVELVLSCPSVSELERWLQATRPPEADNPGEKLYEQWDCPQVIAKHEYIAKEPDLLSLEVGDVVNVTRKLPDGWFNGERIRDGAVGWFPETFTEEVNSAHVRARNLKQRYRLLTFTATYLESQKRK